MKLNLFPLYAMFLAGASWATPQCVIVGDSLGEGVGMFSQKCVRITKRGATTVQASAWPLPLQAAEVLVSVGSNDGKIKHAQLNVLRDTWGRGTRVTWLLPLDEGKASAIKKFATARGDEVLTATRTQTKDGIHPTSTEYKKLAAKWSARTRPTNASIAMI
jgi:hypothetical protein